MITNTSATPPDATELSQPENAKAWKAAKEFETMALNQFLTPMFDTVKTSNNPFSGGEGEDSFRPMLTQEMAKHISEGGGLGIAVPVYRQMLLMQEQAKDAKK